MDTNHGRSWIVPVASTAALIMLAQLVAGRATREALFLGTFGADALPYAISAAGVISVAGAIPVARVLTRFGPGRTVPWLFGASASLFIAEWLMVGAAREVVAAALYLHLAAASTLLISGFWAILNERFDPHSARAGLARVASFATAGGMLGGLLSERISAWFGLESTLVVMGVMHAVCALLVGVIGRAEPLATHSSEDDEAERSGMTLVRKSPYLRLMVATTLLLAVLDAQLDFVIRAGVADAYGSGEELIRFFGIYYTAVGVVTFLVQSVLTERLVGRFGIGASMTSLPGSVALSGAGALLLPGLGAFVAMRAVGSVLANSVYRTGFELLYTPLPLRIKRPTKPLIDVGGDGLGDVIGGGLILVVIAVMPSAQMLGVTLVAIVLATGMVLVLRRLQDAYSSQLARNLQLGEISLDEMDLLARNVADTHIQLDRAEILARLHETGLAAPQSETEGGAGRAVPLLIEALGDPGRAREAGAALRAQGAAAVDALLEALASENRSDLVKLMLPTLLEPIHEQRVVDALLATLAHENFEVRFRSVRAAARIVEANPDLRPDRPRIIDILRDELSNPTHAPPPTAAPVGADRAESVLIADLPTLRVGRRVEHVFTLLSLDVGSDLMRSVLLGLYSDSAAYRGTALEYLESSLPDDVRRGLPAALGERAAELRVPSRRVRAARQLEGELLRNAQSRIVTGVGSGDE